jgi:hypothetical protein
MCVYLEEVGDWVSCEPEFHYVNGDIQDYLDSTGFVSVDFEPKIVLDDNFNVWGDEPF